MTKKDYIIIAKSLKEAIKEKDTLNSENYQIVHQEALKIFYNCLVWRLIKDNPCFDEKRFKEFIIK